MRNLRDFLSATCVIIGGAVAAPALQAQATPPPVLPAVTLNDQFDAPTTIDASHRPTIFLSAGRKGSDAMKRWLLVLRGVAPPGAVRIVQLADVKGAPFFVKGRIRSSMPKDTSVRILLDWEGKFAHPVRGDRGDLVAAAYGSDGKLRKWETLSITAEDPAVALALIRAAQGS